MLSREFIDLEKILPTFDRLLKEKKIDENLYYYYSIPFSAVIREVTLFLKNMNFAKRFFFSKGKDQRTLFT